MSVRHFETVPSLVAFLFGGDGTSGRGADRAVLTMEVNGRHYTYQIKRASSKKGQNPPRRWFLSLLTGPDQYTYLGMFADRGGRVPFLSPTKASNQGIENTTSWKWMFALMERIALSAFPADQIPENLNLAHNGNCSKCGRELTHPESITMGIGPVCADRL